MSRGSESERLAKMPDGGVHSRHRRHGTRHRAQHASSLAAMRHIMDITEDASPNSRMNHSSPAMAGKEGRIPFQWKHRLTVEPPLSDDASPWKHAIIPVGASSSLAGSDEALLKSLESMDRIVHAAEERISQRQGAGPSQRIEAGGVGGKAGAAANLAKFRSAVHAHQVARAFEKVRTVGSWVQC